MTEPSITTLLADYKYFYCTGMFVDTFQDARGFYVVYNINPDDKVIDIKKLTVDADISAPQPHHHLVLCLSEKTTSLSEIKNSNIAAALHVQGEFTLDHPIKNVTWIVGDREENHITVKGKIDINISGGDGDDTLVGGDGHTRFLASLGNDMFIAGTGENTYTFQDYYDHVTIQYVQGTHLLCFPSANLQNFDVVKQDADLLMTDKMDWKQHDIKIMNFFNAPHRFSFKGATGQYNLSHQKNGTYKFELASK